MPPTSTWRPSDWGTPGRRRGGTGSTGCTSVQGSESLHPERRGTDSTHLPAAVRAWANLSRILAGGRTRVETANLVRSQTPEPARSGCRVCGNDWGAAPSAHPCCARPHPPPRPTPPVRNSRYLSLRPPRRDPGPRDPAEVSPRTRSLCSSRARFRSLPKRRSALGGASPYATPSLKGDPVRPLGTLTEPGHLSGRRLV